LDVCDSMDTYPVWIYSLASVLLVSLVSLVGLLYFFLKKKADLGLVLLFLVSFSAGALFGDAFLHLLPEAAEDAGLSLQLGIYVLLGVIMFFILEKFIHWRHCHVPTSVDHPHPLAVMNLLGDGLHNLLDGMIIAGSYLTDVTVGVATTVAVVLHEIPQEIGDFGVLLHSGLDIRKALFFNFLTALTAVVGALLVLLLSSEIGGLNAILIPVAAGGFLYIAGSDLIPELHKETEPWKSAMQLVGIVLGIAAMYALKVFGG